MELEFSNVLIFGIIGLVLVFAMLLISNALNPRSRNLVKSTTYECGEKPFGEAWQSFNIRFYLVVILFLIFELEVAFIVPVATVLRSIAESPDKSGLLALVEILVFVAILSLGLVYVWAKGDLSWVKSLQLKEDLKSPSPAGPQEPPHV